MLKLIVFVLSVSCVTRAISIAQLNENKENIDIARVPEVMNNNNKLNVCLTHGCNETSAYISSLMDETVEPCDDFYQFACGAFLKNDLPDDKTELSNFAAAQLNVYDQLHSVLVKPIHANESKAIALAKTYFRSCMNTETAEQQGIQPLFAIIEKFGGWPVVKGDDWDSENFDWIKLLKNFSKEGLNINQIMQFDVYVSLYNSSQYIINIERPDLNLKSSFLNEMREPYLNFMINVAVMMGANRTKAETEMNETLSFEMLLLNASTSSKRIALKDAYNVFSFRELQEKYPYLNWLEYARTFIQPSDVDADLDENEPVALGPLEFFERLEEVLKNMENRTVANYLIWRSIFSMSQYLNKEMMELSLTFSEVLNGKQKQKPHHIQCIAHTTESLPMPVGELYVRNFFDADSKRNADDLVETLRNEFTNLLTSADWMDDKTKEIAKEKAKYMKSFVAYPNGTRDHFNLDEYYDGLELRPDSFAENFLRLSQFDASKRYRNLHKPIEGPAFIMRKQTAFVNAFYAPQYNSLLITAAILQPPFFDAKRASYVNYAKIGQFIGHEISHGFDEDGRLFNRFGEIMIWWQNDTEVKYKSKAKCFEEQYSEYETVAGDKVNGQNTLDENIADIAGLKLAYNAYQHFVDRNGPEGLLSGLNYTQNQLFWISSTQVWCSLVRPEYLKTFLATNSHAPHQFRAIGMVRNLPKFAQDFKCKPDSPMNPSKKCELW